MKFTAATLSDCSPEYWAKEAPLEDLEQVVRALPTFDERAAEILDFVYLERCMAAVARTSDESRKAALLLADHLERVAHDSVRIELDRLERPYFARWRLLSEIMRRTSTRLEVPHQLLERRHVRDILRHLHHAGGNAAQSELTMIRNEGQRSVTLKLMEKWELIERHANGQLRTVSLTPLGRLALGEEAKVRSPDRPAAKLARGAMYMTEATRAAS